MPKSRSRFAFIGFIAVAISGGTAFLNAHAHTSKPKAQAVQSPAEVDVARVQSKPITDWQSFSGRLEAVESIEIRPQVSGLLVQVHFHDGAMVNRGDVLFTIDPRPYQAELNRAEAQLAGSRARVSYTTTELNRAEQLIKANAIAKSEYDQKQNDALEATAGVRAAQAQLDAARVNLEYTRITAPISGRVSRAEVTLGNVVQPGLGSKPLTTLVSTSPVYASVDVDEKTYLKYVARARTADASVPVGLGLSNEIGYPHEGKLSSVDNRMDTSSGTIRVRAVFDNSDGELVPGLYARVRFGGIPREAILVDDKAIGTDQDKRFVLVVDDQNKAAYREVKLGASYDGQHIIEEGLRPTERIIVSGAQFVRSGDPVKAREVAVDGSAPRAKAVAQTAAPTPAMANAGTN